MLLKINIITDYPLWFSVFCVLLGLVYAFILYRNEERFRGLSEWLIGLMAGFRFLLVTFLTFLLLSPFIKTLFNKVEKPVIIIAQDNSSSILLNKDSTFYKNQYLEKFKNLKSSLAENYNVRTYTFGNDLIEGDKIDYKNKTTDLSNVFDELLHKFYNRNVGALILASDGIFNQGANPIFNSNIEFPVYTIALGDTSVQRDVILKDVIHNRLTFLGNQFPLVIDGEVTKCLSRKTELTITHKGKKLFSKIYEVNSERFMINENLFFKADEVGIQKYSVSLSTIDGEISFVNNVIDVYVEVLDGRQEVLILANAPHPDVKALKLSIESNENYKVTNQLMSDFDGDLAAYSLVVIHQIPKNISSSLKKVMEDDISKLYILGNQTSISSFNLLNVGLNISNSRNKTNEILPVVSDKFPLFSLSENMTQYLNSMPPLIGSFGNYQLRTNGYTLLNQKIGSVKTNNPLMVFFQNDGKKSAVLAAEGIWKWRMQDFIRDKHHKSFNELINKTVQFLSVKEDKSKFRVSTDKTYIENEEVQFKAELYNNSYELVNEPEITINITKENGDSYTFDFNRTLSSYMLNAGILPAGFYNYKAEVKRGTKDYVETGKFQINPLMLEANNTVANHQLLQNLANKFGGKLFHPKEMQEISTMIDDNTNITSVIYEENELKELISLKWIFFALLLLLSFEWFLRKRNGAY